MFGAGPVTGTGRAWSTKVSERYVSRRIELAVCNVVEKIGAVRCGDKQWENSIEEGAFDFVLRDALAMRLRHTSSSSFSERRLGVGGAQPLPCRDHADKETRGLAGFILPFCHSIEASPKHSLKQNRPEYQ